MNMSEVNIQLWREQLDKLVGICEDHGATVRFVAGAVDEYTPFDKTIQINSRRVPEHQFYILLHEFGHHKILRDSSTRKKFAVVNTAEKQITLSKQILLLEEEVLAWHIGEELAKTHGFVVRSEKLQILKAQCLKSHIASLTKVL